MSLPDLSSLPQSELIEIASNEHNKEAYDILIDSHMYIVRNLIKAENYYANGAEKSDLIQEGRIGLYNAIKDYDPQKGMKFENFAYLCVQRNLITAIKYFCRQKHKPLNEGVSLDRPTKDNDSLTVLDILPSDSANPEDILLREEFEEVIQSELEQMLSDREKDILDLYLEKKSYVDIMRLYNEKHHKKHKSEKIVDNALQRAKKKYEQVKEKFEKEDDDAKILR